jgi:hypothetical protein
MLKVKRTNAEAVRLALWDVAKVMLYPLLAGALLAGVSYLLASPPDARTLLVVIGLFALIGMQGGYTRYTHYLNEKTEAEVEIEEREKALRLLAKYPDLTERKR